MPSERKAALHLPVKHLLFLPRQVTRFFQVSSTLNNDISPLWIRGSASASCGSLEGSCLAPPPRLFPVVIPASSIMAELQRRPCCQWAA